MKELKLKAYVRIECIDPIIHALKGAGIEHMSLTHVKAIGSSICTIHQHIGRFCASRY